MGLQLAFWFIVAHALCDYPLQGDFLAAQKSINAKVHHVPWWHALAAHSAIHAGGVAAVVGGVTGNWTWAVGFGALEFIAHAYIDLLKCVDAIRINADQLSHLLCKAVYIWFMCHHA